MLLLKQPVQYKTANASQSMTGRVNVRLQIQMICIQAQLFPENSYNCYRFFQKCGKIFSQWEHIFTCRLTIEGCVPRLLSVLTAGRENHLWCFQEIVQELFQPSIFNQSQKIYKYEIYQLQLNIIMI